MVQANAQHARDVAGAVDARDLQEMRRIMDRAKLTRQDFLSVCERLGFRRRSDGGTPEAGEGCRGDDGEGGAEATALATPELPGGSTEAGAGEPGPAAEALGEGETGAENRPADAGEVAALELGEVPVFFLDAEGKGGTTALALATTNNDVETVRRLVKEVRERKQFVRVSRWFQTGGEERLAVESARSTALHDRWSPPGAPLCMVIE